MDSSPVMCAAVERQAAELCTRRNATTSNVAVPPPLWVLHLRCPSERELIEPIRRLLQRYCVTQLRSDLSGERAFVGLHGHAQARRAEDARARGVPVVAIVELSEQWTARYLHNHGSWAAEVMGYATHVLAPTPIARTLRNGILSSPETYADHIRALQRDLQELHDRHEPRYRCGTEWPTAREVKARREGRDRLLAALEHSHWSANRIIEWGLPRVVSRWFDGERLIAPRVPARPAPTIAFVAQAESVGDVEEALGSAARDAGMRVERVPGKDENSPSDLERGRQLITSSVVVATSFSNLAYQAALSGKRVLYCTWQACVRPLPLLATATFANVREVRSKDAIAPLLAAAADGAWCELPVPVTTEDPKTVLERVERAVAADQSCPPSAT